MKIHKYKEYDFYESLSYDFINNFNSKINESENNINYYKEIEKKVLSDFKLNVNMALTFGTGISALYPIVDSLMKNMNISSIEITDKTIVLLTICALTIIYLEEKKPDSIEKEEGIIKCSKSMLEELRMMGIGNGIVKKLVKALKSFVSIFKLIGSHKSAIVRGFIDMFAYTSIFIPILNSIYFIIGKYDLTIDTFIDNFIGLSMGITTIIAKHGIKYILNKIKYVINISDEEEKDIINDIESSTIKKISDFEGESINEQ